MVLQRYCRLLVGLTGGTGGTTMIAFRSRQHHPAHPVPPVPPVSTACSHQILWSTTGTPGPIPETVQSNASSSIGQITFGAAAAAAGRSQSTKFRSSSPSAGRAHQFGGSIQRYESCFRATVIAFTRKGSVRCRKQLQGFLAPALFVLARQMPEPLPSRCLDDFDRDRAQRDGRFDRSGCAPVLESR